MPRNVRTARGDVVDFDAIIIKQQIANAPMNIEVARRKEFIDSKERKGRGQRRAAPVAEQVAIDPPVSAIAPESAPTASDFEVEAAPSKMAPVEAPVPNIPVRQKAK